MEITTVELIRTNFKALRTVMDERTRRLWAATGSRPSEMDSISIEAKEYRGGWNDTI